MENENIIGIAAVLNANGFHELRFVESIEMRSFLMAIDGKTGTSLSFWCDTPSKKVQRIIDKSRMDFALYSENGCFVCGRLCVARHEECHCSRIERRNGQWTCRCSRTIKQ